MIPAFTLQLRKISARRPSDEGASNGVPFLQLKSIGSHSTSGREKEGKEEGIQYLEPFDFSVNECKERFCT